MIELNLDGYTDIPNGKVANIATFLEMRTPPNLTPSKAKDLVLEPLAPVALDRYKSLFKAVGENWLWFSRLTLDDDALEPLINTPEFEIFALTRHGEDIGLLELDIRDKDNIELGYYGLAQTAVGTGAGHFLMNAAISRVFDHHKASRFFLHTCTMDSPQALAFYLKSGFVPYKRAIEIADDPRLSGHIDADKGKHHPIIR